MRLQVFVNEVQVREGVGKTSGKDYRMTVCSCFDVSDAPAMRLKHALTITLSKDQDHLGPTLKDTKQLVDVYELSENRGEIEARGIFVQPASKPASAAAATAPAR